MDIKKCLLIIGLFTCVILLSGCTGHIEAHYSAPVVETSQGSVSQTNISDRRTIALVMKALTNPFFVEMEKGGRQAEQELGIRLIVKAAAQETSIEQQIEIVENLIQTQVDAIVISPVDSTEIIPVLKKAQDAGIVIINIDNKLDAGRSIELGLRNVPFIGIDNEAAAYQAARYISQQITTPTDAAIIEGIQNAQSAKDRENGALRAFGENPNIRVVAQVNAHWKIDEGYLAMRDIYAEHPSVGAVFCANDMMALGALKYLKESDRGGVLVAGFDNLNEARDAIRQGTLSVTIDQQAARQGYMGVIYADRALNGESLPSRTMIDFKVVTATTVQ